MEKGWFFITMKHYLVSAEEVLREVDSNELGLSPEEAAVRLQKNGANKLEEPPKKSLLMRFLDQFKNPMIIVLLVAAVVSGITGVIAEGKLEAHEYLNSLKTGDLQESAAFAERFARYKAQYAFPEEK